MAYADTANVTVTKDWGSLGTSPLAFTNDTGLTIQVFRQASGTPAASRAGTPVDPGQRYENGNSGEVLYARLMPDTATASPSKTVVVDQWA